MSAWTTFLTKFYNDKKKTNPDYQFKHAMKDAAKVYKKSPSSESSDSSESTTSTRKMSKSRKSRKTKSRRTRKSR